MNAPYRSTAATRRTRGRTALTATILAFTLGLSSCGGDDPVELDLDDNQANEAEPEDEDTDEPDQPEVVEPEVVEPLDPDEPEVVTMVRQFTVYRVHAINTGDVEPMLSLSHPDCAVCSRFAEDLQHLHDDGVSADPVYTETIHEIHQVRGTDPPIVNAVVESNESNYISTAGETLDTFQADVVSSQFDTKREGDTWKVLKITITADGLDPDAF